MSSHRQSLLTFDFQEEKQSKMRLVASEQYKSREKSALEKDVQMKDYCLWILQFYQLRNTLQ